MSILNTNPSVLDNMREIASKTDKEVVNSPAFGKLFNAIDQHFEEQGKKPEVRLRWKENFLGKGYELDGFDSRLYDFAHQSGLVKKLCVWSLTKDQVFETIDILSQAFSEELPTFEDDMLKYAIFNSIKGWTVGIAGDGERALRTLFCLAKAMKRVKDSPPEYFDRLRQAGQVEFDRVERKRKVQETLSNLLDECLATANQEKSFRVTRIDLENMKFTVEFDIVEVPEDNYIGFTGY